MWRLALVLGLLTVAPRLGAQQAPPTLDAYAVFGLENVALHVGAQVVAGAVGANRGSVRLGAGVRVAGSVAADTIRIGPSVRAGSLFCRLATGPRRLTCGALTVPVVDVATLPLVQVVSGAADVRVPAGAATAPLAAGAYGAVRVGPRGRLLLAGGSYAFRSIGIAPRGRLLCAAPCRLSVEENVVLGSHALLGAAAPLDAHAVRLDVEASGHRVGFAARPRATIAATVYAPQSAVVLASGVRASGALVGRTVTAGAGARIDGTR
jgi:hypothetical protein